MGGLAMMTPVKPPKRNVTKKPIDHSIGVSNVSFPPHIVPNQLKNFTPVGTAMVNDMNEKNAKATWPVAYMWCAQTVNDSAAIATVAYTKSGRASCRERVQMSSAGA